jgi:hypothetical protein
MPAVSCFKLSASAAEVCLSPPDLTRSLPHGRIAPTVRTSVTAPPTAPFRGPNPHLRFIFPADCGEAEESAPLLLVGDTIP